MSKATDLSTDNKTKKSARQHSNNFDSEDKLMRRLITTGLAAVLVTGIAGPVAADTLEEALAAAYQNNPELRAARAEQRATDEGVSRANMSFLPRVTASGSYETRDRDVKTSPIPVFTATQKAYEARVDQNLFRGFQDFNNRRQQKSLVRAGRARLLSTEQQILLDAVTAYMNVVRDEAVLELRNSNVQVLTRQLQASQDRFRVGEITRTDVAQSEARLAGADTGRISAEADLAGSRANYERVIGQAPGTLEPPPALPPLPPTLDDAWAISLDENPNIQGAKHIEQASRHAVGESKGTMLPTVDAFARINRFEDDNFSPNLNTTVPFRQVQKGVGLQVRVPLYQGGAEYSDIRRAKQVASQRRLEILSAERQVVEQVRIAWENYRASQAQIESSQAQVRANEIALDGVRQEAAVGSRTTLDVLDAEQELLDSRVNLVTAERNEYIAGFALLSAVGRLNAVTLDLPVDLYDPEENYKSVRFKFIGWGIKGDEDK